VFTEPDILSELFHSNDRRDTEADTRTAPLRWAQEPCIHTRFHKDWFRHSKVNGGEGNSQIQAA
jgi:hypothetical protein